MNENPQLDRVRGASAQHWADRRPYTIACDAVLMNGGALC